MKVNLFIVAIALVTGLMSSPAAGATFTMKIAHAGPATMNNDDYVGSTTLKQYIEEKSKGEISVQIFPGNQLGNYQEVMEQVNAGVLESAHVSIGGVTPFIPELSVVDLQYVLPDDKTAYAFMEGTFTGKMRDAILEILPNVRLAAVSDGGRWRSFFTTDKEIHTAEDLERAENQNHQLSLAAGIRKEPRRFGDAHRMGRVVYGAGDRRCRWNEKRHSGHHV